MEHDCGVIQTGPDIQTACAYFVNTDSGNPQRPTDARLIMTLTRQGEAESEPGVSPCAHTPAGRTLGDDPAAGRPGLWVAGRPLQGTEEGAVSLPRTARLPAPPLTLPQWSPREAGGCGGGRPCPVRARRAQGGSRPGSQAHEDYHKQCSPDGK